MPTPTTADDDSSTTHQRHATPGGLSRWVAPLALVIALVAAAGAGWALFRPAPANKSQVSAEAPTGDAKANACSAFKTVSTAVTLQTHGDAGPEPAGVLAVAANARLAMAGGASYLLAKTGPGTPTDLSDAIHSFADGLQDIAMNALAGVGNDDPAQAARLRDAEAVNNRIAELCK